MALLEDECLTALQGQCRVLLDLAAVTFMSSHGVWMLKHLASEDLLLVNCSAFIEDLLQVGGKDGERPGNVSAIW